MWSLAAAWLAYRCLISCCGLDLVRWGRGVFLLLGQGWFNLFWHVLLWHDYEALLVSWLGDSCLPSTAMNLMIQL